ncbi:MAG: SEL1-like repeat protein, partial [Gammaproteobacteria bacterium]|nr:SEL1-like repeat protein [Gammaproteobacteria bacterium]
IGDKYAQYMLGYMSLSGLGVEEDPVLASAWYRLAAERGEPEEFVRIRDDLLGSLDAPGRERSDQVLLDLRREYSDIAISMREARKEFENLSQVMTGTRLGDTSSAVTIVEPRAGNDLSVDELNYRIQRRMQRHLDNVTEKLGIERIDAKTVTAAEIEALEASVREHLL